MTVTFANQTYDCLKALRYTNYAVLYLTDGGTAEFSGISETGWNQFQLSGGSWKMAPTIPTDAQRLDALEAAVLDIMGGM